MEWSLINGVLTISGEITHTTESYSDWPWYSQSGNVQSVSFSNAYFANGSNAYGMFYWCINLTSFDSSNFDTSEVTNMSWMFYNCESLTSLDLSNFNTSKVTNMSYMFGSCELLTSLDLSSFDTSNVTNMFEMFYKCYTLTSLDLSSFNTSNVINMNRMFDNCSSLTSLDLSSFNTSNVTSMGSMFYYCFALMYIRISELWTTNKVTNSTSMFYKCTHLSNYNSSYTNKTYAYAGYDQTLGWGYLVDRACACYDSSDQSLSFIGNDHGYATGQVVGTKRYFANIETLQASDFQDIPWREYTVATIHFFVTVKPKSTAFWFYTEVIYPTFSNLELLNTSNVDNMSHMFYGCGGSTSLNVSNFDTSKVTDMSYMFSNCRALISLDLSSFDTSNVTDMSYMFYNCRTLTSLDLSIFNTSNVTNMDYMFYYCTALTSLDLRSFNTSKVTNMTCMFQQCSATIPVLYVYRTQCTTNGFAYDSQGIIYLVRDPEVAENTTVRDFWRSVADSYNNVHFEYDDANKPIVAPEINRGKLVNNQWQADESGDIIKIKLNPQVYNNNVSSVLPTNNIKPSGGLSIEVIDCNNYTVSQDSLISDLFYITLNTDSDKQYNAKVILTDLSDISVTRSIILPGVFAMIEFKAGGHGMSIGKICERDGLEVSIPTTIGKGLLPPVDQQGNFDLANYQLVIGKYNEQKNDPLFIIGNGTDDTHRSNLMEVGSNEILIGQISQPHVNITNNGIYLRPPNSTNSAYLSVDAYGTVSKHFLVEESNGFAHFEITSGGRPQIRSSSGSDFGIIPYGMFFIEETHGMRLYGMPIENQWDNAIEVTNTDDNYKDVFQVDWGGTVNIPSGATYKINNTSIFDLIYPVGSIYMSVNNINPGTLFGGEWTPIQNRFLFAAGSFHTAGTEGGSRYIQAHTHSFTGASHNHGAGTNQAFLRYNQGTVDLGVQERSVASGASGNYKAPVVNSANVDWSYIANTGSETAGGTVGAVNGATTGLSGSTAEGNMPPYLTVYMWKRTA